MAVTLDCQSLDSTLESLHHIFRLPVSKISTLIESFDCDAYAEAHPNDCRKLKEILPELLCDHGGSRRSPTIVYWFHGTRALSESSLAKGLNPLNLQFDQICEDLYSLAMCWIDHSQWQVFKNGVVQGDGLESSQRIRRRLAFKDDWGPHGVLVRDALIQPSRFSAVNYLYAPETIEDICESFEKHFGHDLLAQFIRASRPYIVKIKEEPPRHDVIGSALAYLWCWLRDEDCTMCNTCLDSVSTIIPPGAIVEIQEIPLEKCPSSSHHPE